MISFRTDKNTYIVVALLLMMNLIPLFVDTSVGNGISLAIAMIAAVLLILNIAWVRYAVITILILNVTFGLYNTILGIAFSNVEPLVVLDTLVYGVCIYFILKETI